MDYTVNGHGFSVSYKELRGEYIRFCEMSDFAFLQNLPAAIHLACIICWLKEVHRDDSLGDMGIVHQLAHLLDKTEGPSVQLTKIRELFQRVLQLA